MVRCCNREQVVQMRSLLFTKKSSTLRVLVLSSLHDIRLVIEFSKSVLLHLLIWLWVI